MHTSRLKKTFATAVLAFILTGSAGATALTITTASLPGAVVNAAYTGATLTATGGTMPYTWSITSGALPAGLSLDAATGAIFGTPTASAPTFVVQASDSSNPVQTAMRSLSISVGIAAVNPLAGAIANSPYSAALLEVGTHPYICSTTDTLPAGLTLTSATCTISGAFLETLSFANALQITTASGGYPPYRHRTVASGSLPNGFTFDANTGVLGGNRATVSGGPFTFGFTVQDSVGNVSPARSFSTPTATTTSLQLSANPPLYGQSLTLAATVTPVTATGQVTFFDGVKVLGTVPVAGGGVAFAYSLLESGTHSLRAFFIGNASYLSSVSAPVSAVVTSKTETSFGTPIGVATGLAATSALIADFDGDGLPDVLVSSGASSIPFLSNGNGTFFQPASSNLPGGRAAAGDFNGDGVPDLAFLNSAAGSVAIRIGAGNGTFQAPVSFSINAASQAFIATGDFNGDGITDIVTAGAQIGILLGKGDGTFFAGPAQLNPVDAPYQALSVGDFNGDGFPDLATSTLDGKTIVFLGHGDGTFGAGVTYAGATAAISIADFNGDGFQDIAMGAGVLPGRGDGTFGALIAYPSALTGDATPGDFNGDGKIDLLITRSTAGTTTSNVLIGNGDGTFKAPVSYTTGATPAYGVVADFNADGVTDIAVAGSGGMNLLFGSAPLSLSCNPSSGPTQTGIAYSTTCTASGGTAPYTYSIGSGLPAGLVFDAPSATISGTPTTAGQYSFTVNASDSGTPTLMVSTGFAGVIQVPGGGTGGGGGTPGGPTSTLSVSPAALTFTSLGGVTPPSQTVMLTSTVAGSHFISGSTTSGGGWLSATPNSGATDTQNIITVSVDPSALGQGTYLGTVAIITDKGGIASISVTLTVQSQVTVSPTSLAFTYQKGDPLPAAQSLSVFSTVSGQPFTATAMLNSGENWLQVSTADTATPGNISVSVNPGPLAPGSYSATIAVTSVGPVPISVPITLTVTKPALPPAMSVSPGSESFNLTQNGASASGQFTVSNTGGGTLQFSAQATTAQGSWLTLNSSGGSGTATPGAPGSLGFKVDPSGLMPGIYKGTIAVTAATATTSTTLSVMLTVGSSAPTISLSQTALTFQALLNGPTPPSQTFTISGVTNATVQAQVVPNPAAPGVNWLTASTTGASVNTTGLPAGQYYGSISVLAANAVNSPQSISVLLNIGSVGAINVSSGGLIFTGAAGGAVSKQQITLFNPANVSVGYSATTPASAWLSVSPVNGMLLPGANTLNVSADFSTLTAGLQTGTIRVAFDNGGAANIQVDAIATGGGNAVGTGFAFSACPNGSPSFLVPVMRKPLDQSFLQAAVPQTVQVQVVNDCGAAVTAASGGSVQVLFGSKDTALDLHDTGGGIWEATWNPVNPGMPVSLQAAVTQRSSGLQGSTTPINVTVLAPSVNAAAQISGVVNAAAGAQGTPQIVSPGSYVAIYGTGMAQNGSPNTTSIPLPTTLNGTQLLMGDKPLPLLYAGPGQVNALVPQGLNSNTAYPLVVVRGTTRSAPIPIIVTTYQPAVYSLDLSGSGQGIIEIVGTTQLAGPTPAKRGSDYLSIFCTGLGPVLGANGEAPPADGAAASLTVLYKTNGKVVATVGGVNAPVVFSGLTPSLVGLYQVNIQVPAGASAGPAVPVVITVTDPVTGAITQSNSVTVALQ